MYLFWFNLILLCIYSVFHLFYFDFLCLFHILLFLSAQNYFLIFTPSDAIAIHLHVICTSLHFNLHFTYTLKTFAYTPETSNTLKIIAYTFTPLTHIFKLYLHFTCTTACTHLLHLNNWLFFIFISELLPSRITCVCSVNVTSEIDSAKDLIPFSLYVRLSLSWCLLWASSMRTCVNWLRLMLYGVIVSCTSVNDSSSTGPVSIWRCVIDSPYVTIIILVMWLSIKPDAVF